MLVPEIKVRYNRSTAKKLPQKAIDSPKKVADFMRSTFKQGEIELQEYFVVLYLDTTLRPIGYYRHSVGTRNQNVVDGSQIVAIGLKANANSLIIAHNHPSGGTTPSKADYDFTTKISRALAAQSIELIDHVIVTKRGYYSMAEEEDASGLNGWPAEVAKPSPLGGNGKGVMSAQTIANTHFETLPIKGPWREVFDAPEAAMDVMIYGLPKNGKTVFSMKMANYLSSFGPVLYNVADQGMSESTKRIIEIAHLHDNEAVDFTATRDLTELGKLIKDGKYQFVFVDLVNKYRTARKTGGEITPAEWEAFQHQFPGVAFIKVFGTTKEGNFKGGNEWQHDVDQVIEVSNYIASSHGRYGGGTFDIWPDRNNE